MHDLCHADCLYTERTRLLMCIIFAVYKVKYGSCAFDDFATLLKLLVPIHMTLLHMAI